jgi:S1-C subfamily serine protease
VEGALDILHRVAAATVTIEADIPPNHPSVPVLGVQRYGTGAVVDDAGYILSVHYVVLGASRISVTDVSGNEYEAEIVAQDFATGIATLSISAGALPALPRGDSRSLTPGRDVFTVSSVGGSERRSASGFVAAVDPFDAYWEYWLERALWVSYPNPGLGGAPVCSADGALCGLVSLNLGGVGRSTLAIPSEHYYDHVEELLRHGRRVSRDTRAWLGLFCYATEERPVVAGLIPDGPGEAAGLTVGDIVMRIGEEAVENRAALYHALWRSKPGETIALRVLRSGAETDVAVQAGDAEEFFSIGE